MEKIGKFWLAISFCGRDRHLMTSDDVYSAFSGMPSTKSLRKILAQAHSSQLLPGGKKAGNTTYCVSFSGCKLRRSWKW